MCAMCHANNEWVRKCHGATHAWDSLPKHGIYYFIIWQLCTINAILKTHILATSMPPKLVRFSSASLQKMSESLLSFPQNWISLLAVIPALPVWMLPLSIDEEHMESMTDWMPPSPTSTSIAMNQTDGHCIPTSLPSNPLVGTALTCTPSFVRDLDAMSVDSDREEWSTSDQLPGSSRPSSASTKWMPPSPPIIAQPPTWSSSWATQSHAWCPPSPPQATATSNVLSSPKLDSQKWMPPSPPIVAAGWIPPSPIQVPSPQVLGTASPSSAMSNKWIPPSPDIEASSPEPASGSQRRFREHMWPEDSM